MKYAKQHSRKSLATTFLHCMHAARFVTINCVIFSSRMYGVVVILQYNDNDFVVVQIYSIIASNIEASNNMSLSGWRGHNFGAQVQVQLSLSRYSFVFATQLLSTIVKCVRIGDP